MRGRKPVPTVAKTLHGNPGKRALPKAEPKPQVAESAAAPRHLSKDAKAEWLRVTAEAHRLGLVTVLDTGLLAAWCTAWGDYVAAERSIRRQGQVIKSATGPVRNPWLLVRNKAVEQMVRIGSEFGFSPASRPRLGRAPTAPGDGIPANPIVPAASADSFDSFLAGKPAVH